MNRALAIALALVLLTSTCSAPPARAQDQNEPARDVSPLTVVEQAWTTVRDRFYDPAFNGADWNALGNELRRTAPALKSDAELSAAINAALASLKSSHTRHYHRGQREYYELLDIFNPEGINVERFKGCGTGLVHYIGIGVVSVVIDGRTFASDVYEAGPAAKAGVLPGDELISVEDRPWSDITAFADREGKPTRLLIQRTSDESSRATLTVTPLRINPFTLFKESLRASARVMDRDGRRLGYVRVRSYANPAYQEILIDLLRTTLKDVDGLVLDLRGGWGGASPEYINAFNPMVPSLQGRNRPAPGDAKSDTDWESTDFAFRKPLVLLVDADTRSGKEVFAYALKKHARATLVGQKTAGAVLGGSPFPLPDGSLLYLAVRDIRVDDQRLEGVGVDVDVRATRTIPYAVGRDLQFDQAIETLTRLVTPVPSDRK